MTVSNSQKIILCLALLGLMACGRNFETKDVTQTFVNEPNDIEFEPEDENPESDFKPGTDYQEGEDGSDTETDFNEEAPTPTPPVASTQPGPVAPGQPELTPSQNPPGVTPPDEPELPPPPPNPPAVPTPRPVLPAYPAEGGNLPGTTGERPTARGQRPTADFTESLTRRFGQKLNNPAYRGERGETARRRYEKIFNEMRVIANLANPASKRALMMDTDDAKKASKLFEETGKIQNFGAWSIAVKGTAPRHGFADRPCAEFMSEVIRQSYARAGQDLEKDFSKEKGTELIYTKTAAVTGLTNTLVKAGWTVWEARKYRAPLGAILIHTNGLTPSHIYMSSGEDGSWIMDNAAPNGRRLTRLNARTRQKMYNTGAFFLPPGYKPLAW